MESSTIVGSECKHPNAELLGTTVIITIDKHYKCPDCGEEYTEHGEY